MVYAAVFDWRFNHIPLSRGDNSEENFGGFESAMATRKAGWGSDSSNAYNFDEFYHNHGRRHVGGGTVVPTSVIEQTV